MRFGFFGVGLVLLAACGGVATNGNFGQGDGGTKDPKDASGTHDGNSSGEGSLEATTCVVTRVPLRHRSTAPSCPNARGQGVTTTGAADGGLPGTCRQDSDCTMGKNGRCLPRGFGADVTECSYDECYDDSQCPGNVACICRPSPTDTAPNLCGTGSDCRIDSDCGPCGFCSPSQDKSTLCGGPDTIYFCHTSADTCIDDKDCPSSTCNYAAATAQWSCGYQCAPPPP